MLIERNDRDDFKLHCALIQKQDGVKKSDAPLRAWLEGQNGLQARLTGGKPAPIQEEVKK